MSIEKITARILQEARDEAASLTSAAQKEAADRLAEAQAQAMEIASQMNAKAAEDAATLKERKKSVAELEARKLLLGAKQDMIEQSFGEAVKELAAMPEEDYLGFLKEQLAGYTKGEILLSAADKARIGSKLASLVSGSGLTVSEDTADIAGGFILRDGNVSVNGSLESLMEDVKKQITAKLAGILFA